MIYDLQKASLLKRATAFILDFILVCVMVAGIAMAASSVLKYDSYQQALEQIQHQYETQYGVSFEVTQEQYEAMSEEERKYMMDAYNQFSRDPDALYNYNMVVNLTLIILTVSVFLAFLILEFGVPLVLGNGQTVGKKVFGIGLMKIEGVKVTSISLFVRAVLGKFAVETMVPLLLLMMIYMGTIGIMGPVVIFAILVLQIGLMVSSKTNAMIHDALARTVAVDLSSQLIFGSEDELLDYKTRQHQDLVRRQKY